MTDDATIPAAGLAREALAGLRPQVYAHGSPTRVVDPIVEPLWSGIRTLAAVGYGDVALVDTDGDPLVDLDAIVAALADAVPTGEAVLEGYVTKEAAHQASAIAAWSDEMPSMTGFIGLRRNRAEDTMKLKEQSLAAVTFDEDDVLVYVATDLLWLDETALLDVPLLERRRLLESVVVESDAVRIGAFVRQPIERWVASWRMQGFGGLTYKAANSRYLPGVENPDWVLTGMPRR